MPQNRALLHQRIERRFKAMLAQDFESEVRHLYDRGDLHMDLPSMKAVGYRQMWQYLSGTISYDEMVEQGIAATRQLAKRQLTWLRKWPDLHDIYIDSEVGQLAVLEDILDNCLKLLGNTPIYKGRSR